MPAGYAILSGLFKVLLPLLVRFFALLVVDLSLALSLALLHVAGLQLLAATFHVSEQLKPK